MGANVLPIYISDNADIATIEATLKRVLEATPNAPDVEFVYATRRVQRRHALWHDEQARKPRR